MLPIRRTVALILSVVALGGGGYAAINAQSQSEDLQRTGAELQKRSAELMDRAVKAQEKGVSKAEADKLVADMGELEKQLAESQAAGSSGETTATTSDPAGGDTAP